MPLFANEKFSYFEAYLGVDDKPAELLNTKMKLISVHLPNVVRTNGKLMSTNFNPASPAVEASKQKLNEILKFSIANDVENIILHLGFFNSFCEDGRQVIDEIARHFETLACDKVKICIENVPCWMNLAFENESLCADKENLLYFKKKFPAIGIALDIDHVAINTVFQEFYQKYRDRYLLISDKTVLYKEMEKEIIEVTSGNVEYYSTLLNDSIDESLRVVDPTVVHATGSDFCQYQFFEALPLRGESLPMGFSGKISGQEVCDRLNHARWIKRFVEKDKQAAITMELSLREEYDYIEQLNINKEYLNEMINIETKKACR